MGYIYIIKNDINDKVYVGQTSRNIEVRWKEHVRHTDQIIDKAIHKYGFEHFWFEQVEECKDEDLDSHEQYWIMYYNSFQDGYNITTGGQESREVTNKMQEVLNLWQQGLTVNRIVEKTKLNVETVRSYLNKNGIDHKQIKTRANYYIGKAKARPVNQYTKDGVFIKKWDSIRQAVLAGITSESSIQRSLKDGKAHGNYIWKEQVNEGIH